jgi:hypothetical protein
MIKLNEMCSSRTRASAFPRRVWSAFDADSLKLLIVTFHSFLLYHCH